MPYALVYRITFPRSPTTERVKAFDTREQRDKYIKGLEKYAAKNPRARIEWSTEEPGDVG